VITLSYGFLTFVDDSRASWVHGSDVENRATESSLAGRTRFEIDKIKSSR
jgi:hypothetical protein